LQIVDLYKTDFASLVDNIKRGKTLCYPTETIYGLGCIISNAQAIEKIYQIKSREKEKKFSILFKDIKMVKKFCKLNAIEKDLIMKFTPGPLSILLKIKNTNLVLNSLIGEDSKINCRISSHPFVINLFELLDVPIVSTSANLSRDKNIFSFKTIYSTFHNLVDIIINAGDIKESLGSTIVEIENDGIKIIREGDIKEKEIMVFLHGRN